jgi:hypothetical protein
LKTEVQLGVVTIGGGAMSGWNSKSKVLYSIAVRREARVVENAQGLENENQSLG